MPETYSGGCACGAIRYECTADPIAAGHCHCRACQRASGAGHASHLMLPKGAMSVTGELAFYDAPADSGNIISRGFCSDCGSPVLTRNSGMPDMIAVRAASLDEPEKFQPMLVVYSENAHAWDPIQEGLPSFPGMPDQMADGMKV